MFQCSHSEYRVARMHFVLDAVGLRRRLGLIGANLAPSRVSKQDLVFQAIGSCKK